MAQRVRDILLRIRGDASDAERELHDLAREVKDFGTIQAEATVDVNTTAVNRKVQAAKDSVKEFGRLSEQAKIDLQATAAETKLRQLRTNLENLQKKPVTPKVEISIGRTVAQIERVENQLDKLDRRRVDINVDVDRRGGSAIGGAIDSVASGISTATTVLGGFVAAAGRGIPIIGGFGQVLVQIGLSGAALGPIFLALAAVLAAVMLPAVVLLTGAVVALGASLLAAAAGVGVLGVALAGALGPAVLVGIAALARFAKILQAVKGAEDGAAEGASRVRDANQAQAAAQENAVDAAARVKSTAVDAYKAWAQAAEEASDAIRGIAQAELARDQARLNVKKAEQNLKDLRKEAGLTGAEFDSLFKKFTDINFRPENLISALRKSAIGAKTGGASELDIQQGILDLRGARLNEQDAIDGVSDAKTRSADASERLNEFTRQGIAAYEPYTAAVEASEDAQRALRDATEKTADAQAKQNEALKDLTPLERRVVSVLTRLKRALTDVFRPATERIFSGLLDALEDLADFASDRRIRSGFTAIGDAIGDAFRIMGRELRRRETREAFGKLAEGAADLIRILSSDVFRSVFRILMRIATVALPWLKDVIKDIGRFLRGLEQDADKSGIESFVRRVRRSFNLWLGVAKELWGIIKEFFGSAKDSGDELAETIRKILRRFRLWLEENPDAVKEFFKDAKVLADKLLTSVESIASSLDTIIGAAQDAKGAIEKMIAAWNKLPKPVRDNAFRAAIDALPIPYNPFKRRQHGGVIPGTGTGDIVPTLLEPGEYVLRRSVAQAIGVPRLNMLNAGGLVPAAGGRGGIHIDNINLPPAPGHGQLGDPRHQAVMLARELRRRGGQGIPGGGAQ